MPSRRSLGNIIKSDKHEITWSNLGQDASADITVPIVLGTAPQITNLSTEVVTGSKVTSIYFEFHFSPAQTGNVNVIHWIIECKNFGQTGSAPSTYYTPTRALIIKRGMEMLPVNVATVFKRIFVVRVPRVYQRIREGMTINLIYRASSTQTINGCGIAIYKSYT